MAFTSFDYPHKIEHVARTQATVDQGTGTTIPPSEVVTVITGNFEADPLSDENRQAAGLIKEGQAVLYTSAPLSPRDAVRIYTSDGVTYRTFRVEGTEDDYEWFHSRVGDSVRPSYILTLEETE